jgi:uncharacterized protein (DUF2342 family)
MNRSNQLNKCEIAEISRLALILDRAGGVPWEVVQRIAEAAGRTFAPDSESEHAAVVDMIEEMFLDYRQQREEP